MCGYALGHPSVQSPVTLSQTRIAGSQSRGARGPPPMNWPDAKIAGGQLVITINPEDAKDFDDAICLERAGQNQWRLVALKREVDRRLKDIACCAVRVPEIVNNFSPPYALFGPGFSTAGGRELGLASRPPARFISLSIPQGVTKKKKKQSSHRVTPLLAQRIPLPGNSYFWRTSQ
jgi:hypothetical protein